MAFTWTNSIAQGSPASAATLQEIRDNLDYIDNNLACIAHDAAYKSDHDAGVDGYYLSAVDSDAKGSVYNYDDTAFYDGANATVNSGHLSDVW